MLCMLRCLFTWQSIVYCLTFVVCSRVGNVQLRVPGCVCYWAPLQESTLQVGRCWRYSFVFLQCVLSAVWQFQPLGVQDNGKVYYSVAAANVFDVYALAKQENNQTSLAKLKLSHLVPHKGLKRHQCSPSFANLWKEVLSECHHCTHMQCCAI